MRPTVEELAARYGQNLYAAAFHVCGDPQMAEDAVQETFLQYWTTAKAFESEQHLRAWLFRVVINKTKNLRAWLLRRPTVPLEDYMAGLSFPSEEASGLFEAVMGLPRSYRTVIHLFYYEDYSVNEIAAILRVSPGAVKTRLSRGRAELRNRLKEVWEDEESGNL